ncbi:hypothetical protein [Rhodococcus rhodochrous]|uniref:Uncharacterized protein n=1 Tax=Rhodococcus rhodochrous KG-21 TaxID=1441923 RepID=A0A0M9WLW6_RHORH|nr:hypothetical protein [Rhodococcus rhodochrous]KOS53847.1 hypothetical protein Z051_23270 [Rhodococcus rhodochrous KG-21]
MTVLKAVMAPRDDAVVDGFREIDVYDLPGACTDDVTGIYFTGDVDQQFLVEQRDRLNAFVGRGGRVLINGHVQRIFLDGLTRWRKLEFRTPEDLALTRITDHPVWAGVDPRVLLYNTGRRGSVPFEELERIGVAGFYGRGCYLDLPAGARIVHTVGRTHAPLDYEYPLGNGCVLVHGGNDLLQFASVDRGTTHLRTQIVHWLEAR